MILRILLGLAITVVGALITIKAEWFYQNFGPIPWAERKLGTEGGSRLMYKLIGIGGAIIGFMVMTNLLKGAVLGFFRLVFPGF
ncbi:hypothetical protein CL622_04825 [archaeon]|nr:hypothetical protein [archaeon]